MLEVSLVPASADSNVPREPVQRTHRTTRTGTPAIFASSTFAGAASSKPHPRRFATCPYLRAAAVASATIPVGHHPRQYRLRLRTSRLRYRDDAGHIRRPIRADPAAVLSRVPDSLLYPHHAPLARVLPQLSSYSAFHVASYSLTSGDHPKTPLSGRGKRIGHPTRTDVDSMRYLTHLYPTANLRNSGYHLCKRTAPIARTYSEALCPIPVQILF
jgi:hypothetical protein